MKQRAGQWLARTRRFIMTIIASTTGTSAASVTGYPASPSTNTGHTRPSARRAGLWTLAAVAAAAAAALVAPAAPANAESAVVTIGQLEAQGFDVKVDRIGSGPLDQCIVTDVRNPREQTRIVRVEGRNDRDSFIPVVVRRTITVSLDCSR
jgi:hypothetical protein